MTGGDTLSGKVVVVTGGGRGVGRAVALLAASEGGRVVVNDLGADPAGQGAEPGVANEVIDVIKQAGGEAVASGDSISDQKGAERIIQTALDSYGRIDAVINCAGILRDRMFHNMTQAEWSDVIKVHLDGAFNISKAAAPFFKAENSGAYVHYTSTSALMGNIGQTNYMAAKMGVVGLSRGIALDMAKFKVRSNCIAPFAWSRLVGNVPVTTPERARQMELSRERMTAEKIAPLAVFLASDAAAEVSGQIFAARANEVYLVSQPRVIRSVHRSEGWTPKTVAETVLPSLRSAFYPLQPMMELFNWDPI